MPGVAAAARISFELPDWLLRQDIDVHIDIINTLLSNPLVALALGLLTLAVVPRLLRLATRYLLLPLLLVLVAWVALEFPRDTAGAIEAVLEFVHDHPVGASSAVVVVVAIALGPSVLAAATAAGVVALLASQAGLLALPGVQWPRLPLGLQPELLLLGRGERLPPPRNGVQGGRDAPAVEVDEASAPGPPAQRNQQGSTSSTSSGGGGGGILERAKRLATSVPRAVRAGARAALETGKQVAASREAAEALSQGRKLLEATGRTAVQGGQQAAKRLRELANSETAQQLRAQASSALRSEVQAAKQLAHIGDGEQHP